ncbi:Major Facilitator Superfamily [Geosmithia morbida]|uniref:Major Facilitator Superfamily n=1 Tax=Geosmithia morbida TaxID=1094350 RepID=A0A9P4YWZ6_9HYPO|nr:Major Facilitator Superfamily [Geosmithia morbida]KAF4123595.1 Major Facilitator Superfamily [Geosmithia morbida]
MTVENRGEGRNHSSSHGEYVENDARRSSRVENELVRSASKVSIAESFSIGHEIIFVSLICMAQFTTQAALGNCLNIIHAIGDTFDIVNTGELAWLIAGYSLTVGTFILIFGRFGDVFGYKRMLIIGYSWFSIWTMVAGVASYSNKVLFIFARVFQGIGPAILLPNALAILGATYAPGRRKAMVFSLFGACAPSGATVGALFAGLFVYGDPNWWSWTFYSFAIALACMAVLTVFVVPELHSGTPVAGMTLKQIISELDPLGGLTGVLSLVLINFAWNQASVVGWNVPYVYVLLIIGLAVAPVFFYIELKVSSRPLIPFHALSVDVLFVLGCITCGWSCFGIWIFYIWQFFQQLRGSSPLLTAAWISPCAVSGALASLTTGWILHRVGAGLVMVLALSCFTAGTALIMTAPVGQIYWLQSFFCVVIIPWGMDMSFPAATLILSNATSRKEQGISASLVTTVVNYSISLGLGFAGTVEAYINPGGTSPAALLKGFRSAWYMGIGLSGLGIAISMAFLARDLTRKRPTRKIDG